jgi:hypothetical protein
MYSAAAALRVIPVPRPSPDAVKAANGSLPGQNRSAVVRGKRSSGEMQGMGKTLRWCIYAGKSQAAFTAIPQHSRRGSSRRRSRTALDGMLAVTRSRREWPA